MSARTMQNPGVELNEIDRSAYEKVDNSLPNSPTSLIFGVADKGEDMTFEWINSKATLDDTFGIPTTEFESYLYNACIEVLNRGGTCIASKLPYSNEQFQNYNYIEYDTSEFIQISASTMPCSTKYTTIGDIHDALQQVLDVFGISKDIGSIYKMANAISYLYDNYQQLSIDINAISDLSSSLVEFIKNYLVYDDKFSMLYFNDSYLTSYINIKLKENSNTDGYGKVGSIECLDNLITAHKGLCKDTIRIYDMTRAKYESLENCECISSEALSSWTNECLGIVPVIVTPANALYFQNLLNFNLPLKDISENVLNRLYYNSISSYSTIYHNGIIQQLDNVSSYMSLPLFSKSVLDEEASIDVDSLSRRAAKQFPLINFYDANHFDNENLKKIGVVVFKAFKDTGNNGKLNFQLLESFVGSLQKNARDQITKANIFIDDVVNQNSQFIRLFSNVNQDHMHQAATIATSLQPAVSMGFYKVDCTKNISYVDSIVKPLTIMLDKASNRNLMPIDMVVDAGTSNIAQLAKKNNDMISTDINPSINDYDWQLNSEQDTIAWQAVLKKFDNFCKLRKDCMFVADGLRPLCLEADAKIVRPTKPQNTVANSIIPKFKYMANAVDSSYSAGYCNWYLQQDYSNNENYIWIPPSIKAMGAYIYCDTYFHPWSAPAGHTRGVLNDVVDIAFTPDDSSAGTIYSNAWNYAMSYPIDGIVIEGQKTFQSQRTALDRINVRRLMLHLEKAVARVGQQFIYEGNTPYMRQRFVDAIRPILEDAVSGDGIREYAIKCDDELNTIQVIENNELRCKIGVKPVKTVEWIVVDFICTNQSANVVEEVLR